MSRVVPTYWALVPSHSQILGTSGQVLDVGERDAQDSVIVDGRRWPIDPWSMAQVIEPDMGDALVTLVTRLGAEVLEMREETS